jgi:hypothetical protein
MSMASLLNLNDAATGDVPNPRLSHHPSDPPPRPRQPGVRVGSETTPPGCGDRRGRSAPSGRRTARGGAGTELEGPQLLWPFRSLAEARQLQEDSKAGGHSPRHADAEATAVAFTTGCPGFTAIGPPVTGDGPGVEEECVGIRFVADLPKPLVTPTP